MIQEETKGTNTVSEEMLYAKLSNPINFHEGFCWIKVLFVQ